MHLSFRVPLLGSYTVRLDPVRSAEMTRAGYRPDWTGAEAYVPAVERDWPGGSQDAGTEAAPESRRPASGGVDPRALVFAEEARAAVEAHLGDPEFGVSALAEVLGVSRSNLYRRLGASLGHTPQGLIRDRRLGRAARLLEARAGRVGEVAYAVGYRSTAQFSRAFRSHFGVTPSAYTSGDRGAVSIRR